MTLISDLVTRALDVDFDPGTRSADAGRFVRQAIGFIYRTTAFPRGDALPIVFTVTGNPVVTFDATLRGLRISSVLDDLGNPLNELSVEDYNQLFTSASTTRGRPLYWSLFGAVALESPTLNLWPVPDRVYTLTLTGSQEPAVSQLDDADPVPLPDDYEDLPVFYARGRLFELVDDSDMAAYWGGDPNNGNDRGKWAVGVRQLRSDLQVRSKNNRVVPGTWAGMRRAFPQFHRPGLF